MKTDSLLLTLTLLLTSVCDGHVLNAPKKSLPMLKNLNEITRHLRDLTAALEEFDREIKQALSVDNTNGRITKRSSGNDDDDGINCRLSLNEDLCQALEISKYMQLHSGLTDQTMPGKRSTVDSSAKYRRIVSDLKKKRQLMQALRNVFKNAGHVLEREKKWFTCNVNLGFTCQTQEYSAIADYYDFLNSADSPGKRSVPTRGDAS